MSLLCSLCIKCTFRSIILVFLLNFIVVLVWKTLRFWEYTFHCNEMTFPKDLIGSKNLTLPSTCWIIAQSYSFSDGFRMVFFTGAYSTPNPNGRISASNTEA